MRIQPANGAEALWTLLKKKGSDGLTATDAARDLDIAAGYARVRMRAWEKAGLAKYYPPDTAGRGESGHFVIVTDAPAKSPVVAKSGEIEPREGHMSSNEFAAARRKLGLNLEQMARALGRIGLKSTLNRAMRRIEQGSTVIGSDLAERIRALVLKKESGAGRLSENVAPPEGRLPARVPDKKPPSRQKIKPTKTS